MALRRKKTLVDQAAGYVDALKPHVEAAYGSALDFVQDTAIPALSDARDKAGPALADARDKAAPLLADARDRAVPLLADARDRAVSGLADVRQKAAPLVATGAGLAVEKAQAARGLADDKVASLSASPQPTKKRKVGRFVLLAGLAGGVAVLARRLQGGGKSVDNWQASYTPAPAPTTAAPTPPTTVSTPVPTGVAPQQGVEDAGGASPDEALADAAEQTHPVTTPDQPAEVVEIDPTGRTS